jgi:hypothetical protein
MGFCLKSTSTNRWPKGVVPYQIDRSVFPVGSSAAQQVLLAINAWNTSSIVKLVQATGSDVDFINITKSPDAKACSSPIGKKGKSQPVACIPGAAAGVIMHEIGHALGLIHEHMRPDRNSFITVNASNILPGRGIQFSPVDTTDCPIGPYDCGSIMHYGATFFSVDGIKPTITVTNPSVCANIGQRTLLSSGDLAAVRSMYDSIGGLKNKVILNETSNNGPALAFHNDALFLAWRGSGNDNLSVIVSDDGGVTFHGKMISPESSDDAPALASHNGKLFLAFKGSGNDNMNVAIVSRSGSGSHDVEQLSNKVTLGDTTDCSPAIASHNGNLYLAFKGSGNENLNVMVSTDNGVTFTRKHTSNETTTDSPTLVSSGGTLYIGWKGSGNENFSVASVDVGTNSSNPQITGFSNKHTSPAAETSDIRTALAQQGGQLFVSWKGSGNDNFNILFPGDLADFGCASKFTTPESSSHAPALASSSDLMWVAWKGSGNENLSVALVDFASESADSIQQGVTAMNNDLFNQLVQIQATLAASFENLSQGLGASLSQQHFTNLALVEKIAQEKTMICQLEQISQQTCDLVSESHLQTGLQGEIAKDIKRTLSISQTAHPAEELELQRLETLRLAIEKCCPPEVEPLRCTHQPCPLPQDFLEKPPAVDYKPIPAPPPLRFDVG